MRFQTSQQRSTHTPWRRLTMVTLAGIVVVGLIRLAMNTTTAYGLRLEPQGRSILSFNLAKAARLVAKRVMDIILASVALVLAGPVLLAIAAVIRVTIGGPVLFRQQRPGLHGKPFMMIKFRTMSDARDADGKLLPDAERLTRFGKLLRSTSLDELPELLNVLRGEMSLIGPRPLLMQYLDRYSPEQARRHEVRPGITGWAQINGRNAISWEQKFSLDVWYVDHHSLALDLKIMFLTVWKIVKREGISQPGQATMQEFMGTPQS